MQQFFCSDFALYRKLLMHKYLMSPHLWESCIIYCQIIFNYCHKFCWCPICKNPHRDGCLTKIRILEIYSTAITRVLSLVVLREPGRHGPRSYTFGCQKGPQVLRNCTKIVLFLISNCLKKLFSNCLNFWVKSPLLSIFKIVYKKRMYLRDPVYEWKRKPFTSTL